MGINKNKKTIWLIMIASLIVICGFVLIAAHIRTQQLQPRIDFNRTHDQIQYDFAKVYADATEGFQGMTFEDAFVYMAEQDLDHYIQQMHEIMDKYILFLRKGEEEAKTVYIDPFSDIESIVTLEYAYELSKTGITVESEKWSIFETMFLSVAFDARHYPSDSDILRGYIEKPHFSRDIAENKILVQYDYAHILWGVLEETLNSYINDGDIPDEKKKWAAAYMQSDPYGNLCRKLEEQGMNGDGS